MGAYDQKGKGEGNTETDGSLGLREGKLGKSLRGTEKDCEGRLGEFERDREQL